MPEGITGNPEDLFGVFGDAVGAACGGRYLALEGIHLGVDLGQFLAARAMRACSVRTKRV